MITNEPHLSRRGLLAGAAGMACLAGCTPEATPESPSEVRGGGVELPTYQAATAVEPDLPGDAAGVPNCFLKYPRPTEPSTTGTPASGEPVSSMMSFSHSPPTPQDTNQWWQGLSERLGVRFDATLIPGADYMAKLNTRIAGDDLPDCVMLPPSVPRLPEILDQKFEDLTEHLSGDAVLDYPNLANLPPTSWQDTVYNGKIYGIPSQNIVGHGTWIVRGEICDALGVEVTPANADEVMAMAQEVTNPSANQYAFGLANQVLVGFGTTMWNAPHVWGETDGKFIKEEETEEYAEALNWTIKMWQAGVIHPDAFGTINAPQLYQSGNVVFFRWGGIGWRNMLNENYPDLDMWFMMAPTHDGSGGGIGSQRLGTGFLHLVGIKKQPDAERVKNILSMINWMAAPFGSTEQLYFRFGEEGLHHTWDEEQSAPILTDLGVEEIGREFNYIGCPRFDIFCPGYPEVTQAFYELEQKIIPTGRHQANSGLYSPTESARGVDLTRTLGDGINAIIRGQRPFGDLESILDEWRAGGGDTIRQEYETAFAEAN